MSNPKALKDYIKDKSVLVVGNSERLLEKDYSELIDSFDVVIRLNHGAPNQHIGYKTTIWASIYKVEKPTLLREHYRKFKSPVIIRFGSPISKPMPQDLIRRTVFVRTRRELVERFRDRAGEAKGDERQFPSIGSRIVDYLYEELGVQKINLIGFDFFQTGTWYRPGEDNCYKCHKGNPEKDFITNHPAVNLYEHS